MQTERGGEVGLALLLGFAVGAVAALLMAPTPGEETRRRIGGAAKRARGDAEGKILVARKFVKKAAGDVRVAMGAGREAYQEARGGHTGNGKKVKQPELVEPTVGS